MPQYVVRLSKGETTISRVVLSFDMSDALDDFCQELNIDVEQIDELFPNFNLEIFNVQRGDSEGL